MTRHGLVYVARVSLRNDFAIGTKGSFSGEFYPAGGYCGGNRVREPWRVVYDYSRPARSVGWKVGFTTNLRTRLIELSAVTSGIVEVVALRAGGVADETAAHRSLRSLRAELVPCGPSGNGVYGCAREWYRDTSEFAAWIRSFCASWRGSITYPNHERQRGLVTVGEVESLVLSEHHRGDGLRA